MKIGFFDSGLGGLYLLQAVAKKLPRYDYVYLGDTKNLPYGDRTQGEIYRLSSKAIEYLFKRNCKIVIVACNTSSAQALRKIQQEFLPKFYPDRKVLGVIRPTVELVEIGKVCVIATNATAKAKSYTKELKKIRPQNSVIEIAAPELVLLIEADNKTDLKLVIKKYADKIRQTKAKTLILGCTHYAIVKQEFAKHLKGVKIISQDDLMPDKVADYLHRHREISSRLSKSSKKEFLVTKLEPEFKQSAARWFGHKIKLQVVKI